MAKSALRRLRCVVRRIYFAGGHEAWTPATPARLSDIFEDKVRAIMVDRANAREIAKLAELERDHLHVFAAMEPESATYFLGKSFGDAIRSARHAPPDRVTFTLRIRPGLCG